MFIFGRCHRSWAAETPAKYEHDWNYLTDTFAKWKFPVTEKLAKLVTPISDMVPSTGAISQLNWTATAPVVTPVNHDHVEVSHDSL